MLSSIGKAIWSFFATPIDKLVRWNRIQSLPKGDYYLLNRWVDQNRFMKGTKTKLRDKEVYEAGMSKEWRQIIDVWDLSIAQYEAAVISCRGHIPWAPLQEF